MQSFSLDEMLSIRGLLVRAAILTGCFVVGHLAGLSEYTSFLCGMQPIGGVMGMLHAFLGLLYVLAHLAFFVLVPILVIAAGLAHAFSRRT